jgi:uncharacterized protein YndB with AHSA1/START domain/ketosteroid isomerase-like protein
MTSLTILKKIAARPEIVFDALVEPESLKAWIGPDAGPVLVAESDPRVGGKFRLRFRMLDGSEHEAAGEYLEVDRPHKLVMSWQWQNHDDRAVSRIDVSLRAIAGETQLTFTHSLLPNDEQRDSHRAGWEGALEKLLARFADAKGGLAVGETQGLPTRGQSASEIARQCMQAYVDKDRAAIEALIAEDFRFTSPLDNAIDRETYFELCWPNSEAMTGFDAIYAVDHGDQAFITYEGHASGKTFRNTEIHTVRDGKLVAVEVYFGWNLPHKAPPGEHLDADGSGSA